MSSTHLEAHSEDAIRYAVDVGIGPFSGLTCPPLAAQSRFFGQRQSKALKSTCRGAGAAEAQVIEALKHVDLGA